MIKLSKSVVVSELPPCDICKINFNRIVSAKYDGKTFSGPWAYMCQNHFDQYGIGLGLGRGQELIKK
jgi:hypothetical protein